ncbi:hypothetical protein HALA3H3_400013 [Halomonas sp. A3H3]|nr:hypothetical protein HALA3H3_400013 [Halomonas sp. A3H3]
MWRVQHTAPRWWSKPAKPLSHFVVLLAPTSPKMQLGAVGVSLYMTLIGVRRRYKKDLS